MALLICLILFGSGAAGLVFETLWFHQAGLAFGNSVWASSLVMSGFMAGLALGSLLAARFGDHPRRPLLAYCGLEVVIGVSGVLLVLFLPSLGPLLAPLLGPLREQPWLLNFLRLGLTFSLLVLPSTAMGATLPLLTRALSATDPNFGRVLGRLYFWNTLGAVAGTLLAANILILYLGVRGSGFVAAGMNAAAALGAVAIALRTGDSSSSALKRPSVKFASVFAAASRPAALAAGLSGFILLALEVVWFRFLMLFVHGTSRAFALILALVLVGIAGGGLVASFALRRRPDMKRLAAPIAYLSCAVCIVSYLAFLPLVRELGMGWTPDLSRSVLLAVTLMLPSSLLSGALFVTAGALLKEDVESEAVAAGALTFANTAAAALGSLVGGFILLPGLGMERSIALLAALYLPTGLLLSWRRSLGWGWVPAVAGVAAAVLFTFGQMEGNFLGAVVPRFADRGAEKLDKRVVEVREGLTETAAYLEHRELGLPYAYTLLTNGFGMSASHPNARRYMKLYVYLAAAAHPDLRDALLIAYGVGNTAKALTDTESLEHIDVVDISREVLGMSGIVYPDPADHPLYDPRVHVHIEDGRYFLETTERSYDLITAEPPPPRLAGVGNLYSREYFDLIFRRLNPGGFVTYWLPLHSLSESGALAIISAFCDVFEDCSLWGVGSRDLMLVGTRNAQGPVSEESFTRQWRDARVSPELTGLGFEVPEQLGALFIGGARYLRKIAGESPPLVDDFPRRLDTGPLGFEGATPLLRSFSDTTAARRRFMQSPEILRLWPAALRERTPRYFEFQAMFYRMGFRMYGDRIEPRIRDLSRVQDATSLRFLPVSLMGSDATLERIAHRAARNDQNSTEIDYQYAVGAIADRDYATGAKLMASVRESREGDLPAMMLEIYALCRDGQFGEAAERLDSAGPFFEEYAPEFPSWIHKRFLAPKLP